jgi:hypothetical protein
MPPRCLPTGPQTHPTERELQPNLFPSGPSSPLPTRQIAQLGGASTMKALRASALIGQPVGRPGRKPLTAATSSPVHRPSAGQETTDVREHTATGVSPGKMPGQNPAKARPKLTGAARIDSHRLESAAGRRRSASVGDTRMIITCCMDCIVSPGVRAASTRERPSRGLALHASMMTLSAFVSAAWLKVS